MNRILLGIIVAFAATAVHAKGNAVSGQAKAKEVSLKILARHDRAQVEFDRVEGINFERRIIRLLQYRMQRIANGQLPG